MKKRVPIIIVSGLLVISLAGNVAQIVNSQQQIANSEKHISELQAEFSSLEKLNNELLATANQAKQDVNTFKATVTNLETEIETLKQDDLSERNEQYIFGKTVGLTDKELETLLGSDYKPSDEVLAAVKNIPSAQTTTPKTTSASSKPTGGSTNTQKPSAEEAPPIGGDPVDMSGAFSDLSQGFVGPGMTPEEIERWNNTPGAPGLSE